VGSYRREYRGEQAVAQLQGLQTEGEEFNLRVPEMEMLRSELARCEWLHKAREVLDIIEDKQRHLEVKQEVDGDREVEDDHSHFEIPTLTRLINDSCRWIDSCEMVREAVNRLTRHQMDAVDAEGKATELLHHSGGLGLEAVEARWEKAGLHSFHWLNAQDIDSLREELVLARDVRDAHSIVKNAGPSEEAVTLRTLEQLDQLCEKSLIEVRVGLGNLEISKFIKNSEEFAYPPRSGQTQGAAEELRGPCTHVVPQRSRLLQCV